MDTQATDNPFVAGTGTMPPCFAGREDEKGEIAQALVRINKETDEHGSLERVSPPVVLIGPRGVGKTALTGWAARKARDMGVRFVLLDEETLGGPVENLAKEVMDDEVFAMAANESTFTIGLGIPKVLGVHEEATQPAALSLKSIIRRQVDKGPLLLVLDEAHAVEPGVLREFRVAVQGFVLMDRPLALVLAGTPGLRGKLRTVGATFMERSSFMPINLLARDEAREALSVPTQETGVPMDGDALEALVDWADCYPYFIQVAGREAWKVAKGRDGDKITFDDAQEALGVAEKIRRDFYDERYQELATRELKKLALQAIAMIEAREEKSISIDGLLDGFKAANDGMKHAEAVDAFQKLNDLGFIYKNEGLFEAGIPSLFDYVKEQGAA